MARLRTPQRWPRPYRPLERGTCAHDVTDRRLSDARDLPEFQLRPSTQSHQSTDVVRERPICTNKFLHMCRHSTAMSNRTLSNLGMGEVLEQGTKAGEVRIFEEGIMNPRGLCLQSRPISGLESLLDEHEDLPFLDAYMLMKHLQ